MENRNTKITSNECSDRDRALITQSLNGNEQAMFQLYHHYSKGMLNTANRIVNNHSDAQDVMQESFIKAFENLESFSGESTFGAWIKRITINKSINHLKKNKRFSFIENAQDLITINSEPSLPDDNREKIELLNAALAQLPDGYRTVFTLYVLEGYDHEEIGQILSIGQSTSISQLSRAKSKLRQIIQTLQENEKARRTV